MPNAPPTPSVQSPAPANVPSHPTERDPIDLAKRLAGKPALASRLARETTPTYELGHRQQFSILEIGGPSVRQADATLLLITPHAYFYVEDGVQVSQDEIERAGQAFEAEIYPKVTSAFGNAWSPGVDSDPHITIFHGRLPGLGGYFTDQDEFPQAIAQYSNEREAIYLNGDLLRSSSPYKYVLAHELQHLIHWNADHTEESWVNEGLSEVSGEMLGGSLSSIPGFLRNPDLQLTSWDSAGATSSAHYGASHLFFRYLLKHYGGVQEAHDFLAEQADGAQGINDYLANNSFTATFEDVFADWAVANYLDDGSGGRYDQEGRLPAKIQPTVAEGPAEVNETVRQFGADYIGITSLEGEAALIFEGATTVPAIPTQPHSGSGMWWSGAGDGIDTSLTASFDLSQTSKATLRFWTWYDIEEGWDYGYVLVSKDSGMTWEFLAGPRSTTDDPVGQAYGPGYSGQSNGWVEESIDLTAYAGEKMLVRFEYITDEGTHRPGWAIDDISVPELNFSDNAESTGAWVPQGFQRLTGPLSQRFVVQLIETRNGVSQVRRISLDAANRATVSLPGGGAGLEEAVLVVTAVTDGTAEPASYRYSVQPGATP